ncbi:hypothetical protein KQI38_00395 [Tissierella carlieri]|nr:hypothetical protein [Tissierella carlieri]
MKILAGVWSGNLKIVLSRSIIRSQGFEAEKTEVVQDQKLAEIYDQRVEDVDRCIGKVSYKIG